MNSDTYKTKDLWEAGALLAVDCRLKIVERAGSVCYFVFDDGKTTEKLSKEYYYGTLLVNAYKYQEAVNRLKKQIFNY